MDNLTTTKQGSTFFFRKKNQKKFVRFIPWGVGACGLILPLCLTDYFSQVAAEIMIYAIFAMSLDLLLGTTGLMSFGHAAFFGLGAYTLLMLGNSLDLSPWLGLVAGTTTAAIGAVIIGIFCVRVTGIPFLMLTLAFSQLLYSAAVKWRPLTGGSDGMSGPDRPDLFGLTLDNTTTMYYVVLVAFALVFVGLQRLVASPLGHALLGIKINEPRMQAMGYRTRSYKLLSFTIGGAIAGFAGGLYAIFNDFISPDALHWSASGDVLIMVVLGGAGTLIGPVIGAASFLLLKYLVSAESRHWILIIGCVFIACVLFFPQGIYGTARQWLKRS